MFITPSTPGICVALVEGVVLYDLMTCGGSIPKRLETPFSFAKIALSVVAGSTSNLSLGILLFKV